MDTNLFIAKDVNPDQFAKAKTIADEMGLSPQFVNNSLPEFEKKQNELKVQNDLNELTYSAPVTKEFVSNPDNLILSQDSLKELSDFEQKIARRNESQYYNNFVSGIYGMTANVAQLPGVFGYIQRENQKFANKVSQDINIAPTDLVPDVEVVVSEQDAKEQFQYFKNNSFVNNLRENQNYFAAKAPDAQMSVIDEAKKGNFLNAGRALSLQVVGNAPNLIANMAAYWAGGPVAGSVTAFVPTFSQGATEAIEKGKPESALTSGAVQGAAEVLFENLGSFRILKNTEQKLVKTIGKEGAKEVIFNSAKQLVNNSFQEGTEEFATSIAQDLTKYIVENDSDALKGIMTRAFDSFLVGAGSGVGISAAGNVSGLIRYNQKIRQAESDAELYSALAGKTKLSERSTEAQKQFIAKQTEGGPIENTYITREGFKEYAQKQNKSETEIAQEMGILEEFNKSVETETDIEVSTAKMATDVAKSIHHAELKNDIKFSPENLSYNEAQKAQDETKTQVQEQFDAAMAAMPEESQIKYKESAKEVYKLIAQDLRNTDKMSAQELSANAQIWENTFLTYGVLTNTDPLELFKKYGVNIRAIDQSVDFDMDLNNPAYDEMMTEASIENGEILNIDDFALDRLKKRINESQAGFRTAKINDNNEMVGTISGQSTFPEFFKNKGLTRDSVLNIIDKYKNKKKLTDNQKETLVDLYNSLIDSENRREYYQSVPTLNQKSLIENSKKLQEQGFKFDVSETPVFDENDNEISIDVGQPGYQFTVFAEDNTGNEIGRASFIVDEKGQLMANDEDGMIEAVTVDASFRRQGIASELYRLAAEHVGKPIVDVNAKTDQGKAFRQSLRELNPKTFFQSSKDNLGFYSKLISTVEQKMSATQDVNSLKSMLKEIKADEAKWLGLDTFLKGKEKVSKAELLDYLKANDLGIQEVQLGVVNENEVENEIERLADEIIQENIDSSDIEANSHFAEENEDGQFVVYGPYAEESVFDDIKSAGDEAASLNQKQYDDIKSEYYNSIDFDNLRNIAINNLSAESETKYSDYKTPNGENYREVLFTLPVSETPYKSSHWDQANVLAHTRLQDFTDADGKKVLLIDEIQSDWHQEGRKKGYKGYALPNGMTVIPEENEKLGKFKVVDSEGNLIAHGETRESAIENIGGGGNQVPDAPFAKNWHEFVFKRILTMAVEQGYDKVAWTYGEQQAERFFLSKQVDSVKVLKNDDGTYNAVVFKDDRAVQDQENIPENKLSDYFGKDLAEKIIAQSGREDANGSNIKVYEGVDLKVGGEGMKGFYDKILVDYAKKLGKKFGTEVKDLNLVTGKEEKTYTQEYQEKILAAIGDNEFKDFKKVKKDSDENRTVYKLKGTSGLESVTYTVFHGGSRDGKVNFYSEQTGSKGFRSIEDFKDIFNKIESKDILTSVHSMEITDKLKQQVVGQGFELFQDKKASFQILGNKQFNINLFETSDESSFMHESAHYFLEVMKDLATEQNARPEMVELFNDVLKTLNVESADQIGEQQQEIFARSFEAYLMKGEAPSKGLRKAFAQFKTFLINIYKNLTGLEKQAEPYGINVSDQMKAVFDRMLVAGEEILDAEKNGPQSLFTDAVLTGLNAEKAEKYINAMNEAREYAEDELRAKLMKDVIKKKDKAFNEKYDELVQKGIELANSLTEFKAMQTIRENEQLKISKPYVEKYFPELLSYIPKDLMIEDGGINPDFVAEMFGYPTGYAMLEAIKPYRKGAEAFAETYAATKIKEQFPELLEQPELSDEAIKAAHNENYRRVKRLELEFLQEQFPQIVKETAGRLIRRMPKTQAVIQQADNIIAQTNVSQIKPHLFLNAERKHAADAARQFKKGEFELAFEAKRKEYLNFELYRAAIKAKEDVNKSVKSFKRLFKSDEDMAKRYDMDLINASRAILAMYGIGKPGKLPSEYIEKIKQYDAEAYITIEALVKSVMDGAANYESVSYDKFVEMRDTVNAIFDLARSNKEFEIEGKKIEMESIVDDLSERLKVITPADTREYYKTASEWEYHKDMLLGAVATTKRVESWALGLGGNFHKYIYQPIADATTAYRLRKIEVLKQYRSLLDTYIKGQPGFEEPIVANELKFKGKTFVFQSKSELITLLLHTGNESNKSKMLEGYGWGERNQQGELVSPAWDTFINRMIAEGKLTKNDFDFAQGVWDLFESLKPEIQKTHKKLLGFYMKEITANEFTNQFGTYRGGYAPAKTDYTEVTDTKTRELLDQINSDASMVFPTTGRGATKSRVESYKAPLSRDINLIGSHIDWALRYAYIEPQVKQAAKMFKNKKMMSAMSDFDKAAIENMLSPWLDRTAKQKVVEQSKDGMWRYIGNMAAFLRRNVNMQIMTFNVVNSLEQFGGLAVAFAKVKPKYIRTSLINYMSNGPAMVDDIMIKSDFMRSINGENIYDIHNAINEIIVKPTKTQEFQDFARKNVYVLQSATQNIVNTIVWSGAYAEAKDSGVSENEAIKLADSVVRTTQGTNLPEDISKFETGSQTELLFKTYVSYFNMLTNLAASRVNEIERSVGLRKGAGELFYLYAAVLAVPSAISMALRLGAAGVVDEDDDDFYIDDLLANFFGYQLKTVAAGIPYAGQFAVAGINRVMTKNQLDDRVSLSPAVSILENMVTVPGAVAEQIIERGELSKKTVKDALMFLGVASSLPIGVLGKPVGYIMDVESGKAQPSGPIDFTRGLVTGKPGSQ